MMVAEKEVAFVTDVPNEVQRRTAKRKGSYGPERREA
jgi:hypothetical protein